MKPSVLMLSVSFGVLAGIQVLPESLPVSVAQIGLTGSLLVWFVAFILRRAHARLGEACGRPGQVANEPRRSRAGSVPNQAPSRFPQSTSDLV